MNRVWKVESNTGSWADIVSGCKSRVVDRPFSMTMRRFSAVLSPGKFVDENTLLSKFSLPTNFSMDVGVHRSRRQTGER